MKRVYLLLSFCCTVTIHAQLTESNKIAETIKKYAHQGILGSQPGLPKLSNAYPVSIDPKSCKQAITDHNVQKELEKMRRERELIEAQNKIRRNQLDQALLLLKASPKQFADASTQTDDLLHHKEIKILIPKVLFGFPEGINRYYEFLDKKLSFIEGRLDHKLEYTFEPITKYNFDLDISASYEKGAEKALKACNANEILNKEIRADLRRFKVRIKQCINKAVLETTNQESSINKDLLQELNRYKADIKKLIKKSYPSSDANDNSSIKTHDRQ
jgi:hypothetical protein